MVISKRLKDMRRYVFTAAMGLSVVVSHLVTAGIAAAQGAPWVQYSGTLWRNFKTSVNGGYYWEVYGDTAPKSQVVLTDNNNVGPTGGWSLSPDPDGSGYWRIVPDWQGNPPGNYVVTPRYLGLTGYTVMSINTAVGSASQDWLPVPAVYDANGALCYVFFNRASPGKVLSPLYGVLAQYQAIALVDHVAGALHPEQAWCAYAWYTSNGYANFFPQNPPPL